MKKILIVLSMVVMASCNKINPFLGEWKDPYGIPPFDRIEEKDYIRALKFGIRQQEREIDAIIAKNDLPTFANTIEAYERSGAIIDRVVGVLFNLSESDATPSMQKISEKAMALLTEHNDNIFMNPYFFERVKTLYDKKEELGLTREQEMTLDKVYRSFIGNGISLDSAGQARIRAINKELASLRQRFGNNLLAQTNSFRLVLNDTADLAGLPDAVIASAAADAQAAGLGSEGVYLFTLHNPSYIPFMTYSSRRDLREKMFRAYSSRGNNGDRNDNKEVVVDIIRLSIEKANMLGYKHPADFILSDKMAHDAATVDAFLEKIFAPALAKAEEEVADMQLIMDEDVADGILPDDSSSVIRPWDWAYYAEKVRKRKFDLDEDALKPYFRMENVREGVFATAHRLYGLNFSAIDSVTLYHPDVEAFKVTDADGSLIGVLLTDYFPRSTKRGGAWMNNVRNQEITADGVNVRPIIVNVGNFTKPTADTPSLLTLDEVSTMFHEFGHALHGLLSQCSYKDVSGTSVARDFVELPSQINENWAFHPQVLSSYAKHYLTGEVIPDELVAKIRAAGTFNQGFMTTELTAASILDMKWYELTSVCVPADCPYASSAKAPEAWLSETEKASGGDYRIIDPVKFEDYAMKQAGLIEQIIPRYRTTYFNHIFNNGYNAGYYSYLWAEVLDKDAFELFKEKGVFDPETARSFRTNILEKGGSEEPMTLYKRFRGADPDPAALLRARGLI